jgi:hypothetical protein
VIAELQKQLTPQERELDSRDGTIIAWEEGLMAYAHALGDVSTGCDADRAGLETTQWDFFAYVCTSSS